MKYFPVVFEQEPNGVHSAYVPGLGVYGAGPTKASARKAIAESLRIYLEAEPDARSRAEILVAKVDRHFRSPVAFVGAAALVGRKTSRRKATASRANGKLGGRPRKDARTE